MLLERIVALMAAHALDERETEWGRGGQEDPSQELSKSTGVSRLAYW